MNETLPYRVVIEYPTVPHQHRYFADRVEAFAHQERLKGIVQVETHLEVRLTDGTWVRCEA